MTNENQAGTVRKKRQIDDKLITASYTPDYINELFRSLRTKIILALHECEDKSVVFTSLDMEVGKSTISSNVAITMAQQDLTTVLIDGDMRRGVLHNSFVLNKNPGLSDFLSSDVPVTDQSVNVLLQKTHVPNLTVVTSGQNVPNPSELLTSKRFREFKRHISAKFELVIFDSPPVGAVTDAVVVHDLFSRYVVIAKAGATNIIDLNKKVDEFPAVKKKIIGIILNKASIDRKIQYYKYSNYRY
ncbi:MAG: polysaccharide biosynthesis tyrosine autokinase [Chitinivibrionales bacterium]|nr:polysaccharide biosynthesis tyrosine autokinase [Chitinivibrionales bacterium]